MVCIDDGEHCYKVEYVKGNGEIIAVKDVTEDFPICASDLYTVLKEAGYDQHTIDFINGCLVKYNIAN